MRTVDLVRFNFVIQIRKISADNYYITHNGFHDEQFCVLLHVLLGTVAKIHLHVS